MSSLAGHVIEAVRDPMYARHDRADLAERLWRAYDDEVDSGEDVSAAFADLTALEADEDRRWRLLLRLALRTETHLRLPHVAAAAVRVAEALLDIGTLAQCALRTLVRPGSLPAPDAR